MADRRPVLASTAHSIQVFDLRGPIQDSLIEASQSSSASTPPGQRVYQNLPRLFSSQAQRGQGGTSPSGQAVPLRSPSATERSVAMEEAASFRRFKSVGTPSSLAGSTTGDLSLMPSPIFRNADGSIRLGSRPAPTSSPMNSSMGSPLNQGAVSESLSPRIKSPSANPIPVNRSAKFASSPASSPRPEITTTHAQARRKSDAFSKLQAIPDSRRVYDDVREQLDLSRFYLGDNGYALPDELNPSLGREDSANAANVVARSQPHQARNRHASSLYSFLWPLPASASPRPSDSDAPSPSAVCHVRVTSV